MRESSSGGAPGLRRTPRRMGGASDRPTRRAAAPGSATVAPRHDDAEQEVDTPEAHEEEPRPPRRWAEKGDGAQGQEPGTHGGHRAHRERPAGHDGRPVQEDTR